MKGFLRGIGKERMHKKAVFYAYATFIKIVFMKVAFRSRDAAFLFTRKCLFFSLNKIKMNMYIIF